MSVIDNKKRCSRCKQYKPLDQFGKHKHTPTGWSYCCLECRCKQPRQPQKPKTMVTNCENCGKEFTYQKTHSRRRRFCSVTCRPKRQTDPEKHVTKNCPICGKEFTHLKCQPVNHCSLQCLGKSKNPNAKTKSICPACGKEFEWYKSWPRKYCGMKCARRGEHNPAWKGGGKNYYGPDWHAQRRKARKRDNYTCQHCGITEKKLGKRLHVHHIIPFREFSNPKKANRQSNLISLCRSCHKSAEHHKIPIQPSLPIDD